MLELAQFLNLKLTLTYYETSMLLKLAYCGLQATCRPLPVFVNKVLLKLGMLVSICIIYRCFHSTKAELVIATETIWTVKPKIVVIWCFLKNTC